MFTLLQNWLALTKKILCNNHGGWDWDIGQWFTPPKSKSPWTAMTAGSTGGWAGGFEPLGPLLTKAVSTIPGYGQVLGAGMGMLGMGGKGSGYQGSDFGDANWGSTIGGGISGAMGSKGWAGGALSAGSDYLSGNYGDKNSVSQPGQWYNSSLLGGIGKGLLDVGTSYLGQQGDKFIGDLAKGGFQGAADSIGNWGASAGAGAGGIGGKFAGGAGGGSAMANAATGTPGSFGAWGTSQIPNYSQNFGNATGSDIMSMFNPYTAGQVAGQGAKGIDWGQVAGGLGTALAPSMMGGQTPQIPESAMYGDITSRLLGGKGISEIGQMGREKLMGGLEAEFSPVPDEYYNASTRRLDEAYDKAEKDFATQYQGMRPGADVGGDSAYREGINKLRQDRAREKSGIGAELDYRREADYYDRQYQSITQALGVDQQTMQDYMSLAQMDADRLATNTGITMGEATQFKEIFGQLGGYLMQRGLGLNDPTKALQSLMTRFA